MTPGAEFLVIGCGHKCRLAVDRRYTDLCEYGGQCDVRQTTDRAVDKRYTDLKSTENSVRRQTTTRAGGGSRCIEHTPRVHTIYGGQD